MPEARHVKVYKANDVKSEAPLKTAVRQMIGQNERVTLLLTESISDIQERVKKLEENCKCGLKTK